MTWSLATPTWVAPSARSCSVEREHADGGGVRPGVGLACRAAEVLAEQLVGAVDEVDLHRCLSLGHAEAGAPGEPEGAGRIADRGLHDRGERGDAEQLLVDAFLQECLEVALAAQEVDEAGATAGLSAERGDLRAPGEGAAVAHRGERWASFDHDARRAPSRRDPCWGRVENHSGSAGAAASNGRRRSSPARPLRSRSSNAATRPRHRPHADSAAALPMEGGQSHRVAANTPPGRSTRGSR